MRIVLRCCLQLDDGVPQTSATRAGRPSVGIRKNDRLRCASLLRVAASCRCSWLMNIADAIVSAKVRNFASLCRRASSRRDTSSARSLIFLNIGNRVRFCNLPLTERLRMPSLSSCACKEAHTRRRIDLRRQFVGHGNNARQVRDKTLVPATFTDLRACRFPQRRTTITRVRLALSYVA